jgi:hypothetical protein
MKQPLNKEMTQGSLEEYDGADKLTQADGETPKVKWKFYTNSMDSLT